MDKLIRETDLDQMSTEDLGLTYESRSIGTMVRRKTTVAIPYRDSVADLSLLYNGRQTYDDRTLVFKFWKKCKDKYEKAQLERDVSAFFFSINKNVRLYDTRLNENEYFKAECTTLDTSESKGRVYKCTATFVAEPYMYDYLTGEEVSY